jgi:hypothetical protein
VKVSGENSRVLILFVVGESFWSAWGGVSGNCGAGCNVGCNNEDVVGGVVRNGGIVKAATKY